MVANGVVSSGVDIPEECLATPGFHASIRWAFVCNQSKTLYGAAGQKQRGIDETQLMRQMTEYLGFEPDLGGVSEAVWPAPVVSALTVGVEEGAGLHNIAATLQSPSPEFADLPTTELGVPDFSRMTYTQKTCLLISAGSAENRCMHLLKKWVIDRKNSWESSGSNE